MKYLLGIDFGGGASKATLLSEKGEIAATATCEYQSYYPQPGFVEQKPEEWVNATCTNIKSILDKSGIDAKDIECVALDAATHTAVIMDENFNVLCPSVYWTDTRSKKEAEYLKENYGDIIFSKVLHEPGTIWTLPELLWIKNNNPDIWSKTKKILFAKDYVRHVLTGDYVTDYIEAEGSMLFDINTMSWSDELCKILDIDTNMMPDVVNPKDIIGTVTEEASRLTGLCEGTKVICGTTDTVMEVFASGAVKKGDMTLKLATAGRICVITDKPYPDKNLINYSHISEGLFYPGTATKSCAASYRWFRDTFGDDYETLNSLAKDVNIGCDGLVFHPYLNGELTPYANPDLCADFVGIRSHHTKGHFARAVLEGVAMSMLDCKITLDSMNIEYGESAVIIGGGSKSRMWCQMVSDALGLTLKCMKYADSSFGSAMLAGIAMGIFKDEQDAINRCNCVTDIINPIEENIKKYNIVFKRYKAVQKALEPIYNGEYV